jgi:cysteine synthase A
VDFSAKHIRGSLNSPLKGISPQPQDIFGHAELLHELWKNLRQKFDEDPKMLGSKSRPLIVLCYDGEVSRLATSVLRGRDYKAINIANGFPAFYRFASSRK